MKEIIYEDRAKNIKITANTIFDLKFIEFAENSLWGTKGIIYKLYDLDTEFKKFRNPLFVTLTENDETVTECALNHKLVTYNHSTLDVFYRTILCSQPTKMNKGYATLLVNKITEYIFSKFDKVLIYSYVEEGNERSKRVLQKANYSQLITFIAASHVWLNPKLNKNVVKLGEKEKDIMLDLLNSQYQNHSFVDINESFDPENYYILKTDNIIKAGLQIRILRWSFVSLAGFEGFLLMNVVPWLPRVKKIFDPKNHAFLKIGNIFFSDKESFAKLLHSILNLSNLNTSLAYTNPNSPIDSEIIGQMKKGMLSSLDSKVVMYYKAKNVTLSNVTQPQFLSLADS